jgi:hypothetical protein
MNRHDLCYNRKIHTVGLRPANFFYERMMLNSLERLKCIRSCSQSERGKDKVSSDM